ncbi:2-dehydropantoate 2-reductase [Enterovibrio norvegicus]|uniref:2-dehydropantoate 2-reductase n=1 Tax=Enterovibrio norvegicus DSM 15893 TaxID=1121869 RepID=A0A1I5QP56_9GAMM|nr:2-dehydropantoate 2-reductase [Enterovibrio norvegicus]OEE44436.1 2-dehydropantoate 2-reductase [Enterovibrio norvegicus]SFP48045.1 2-dehydropantoate 2-reductase [Enterovibrio norvegicus DSM 15893]
MHFTLVGAGAVGTLWGLKLQNAGHHVHFWTRAEQNSLTRSLESQAEQHFPANNPALLADSDCILVCVKAFQVDTALNSLLPHLHQDTPVILMHNGMGTAQSALEKLGTFPLLLATTSQASLLLSETTIRHTGMGETRLGGINPSGKRCDFLTEVLNHALPPCAWENKIEQALWQKLAINCMINPLTGIFQIQNGELTKPEYSDQLHQLASEIALVMRAEGIDTDSDTVLQRTLSVANATATNYSSMNRDVFFKRASEIDAITGYLIHCANRHRIATPENQALYLAIKNLEQSYDHP